MKPNNNKIKILYKKVGELPEVKNINNTLEEKQKLVNGLIEIIDYDDDILLICNEEGKILNMEPNLLFDYDYIAGDCFFIGDDYKNADFKSLTDEQIEKIKLNIKNHSYKMKNINLDEKEI